MTRTTALAPFHPGTPWHLFNFESPESAAPAVAEPAAAEPASDPEAGAVEEPSAAVDPATPAWGPDQFESPEFRFAVDQAAQQYLAQQQQAQQPWEQQQGPALEPPEPWSDNYAVEMQQYLDARDQRLIEAIQGTLGPVTESFEQAQVKEGRAESLRTFDTFSDLGDFDREEAFSRAQTVFTDYVQRYGPEYAGQFTGRALREAAEKQASYEKTVGDRAVERYRQSLEAAAGRGGGDPAVSGTGSRGEEAAGSYDDVLARWDARRQAGAHQV